IEWLLLINLPVDDFEDAVQVIEWYCCRWQIEVYHKVIKSGCRVEDCRLQTADRLQNYIALMSVIAWRLHWLTYINRVKPDLPCTVVLTPVEWQALYMRIHHTTSLPESPPTVHQAVRRIAKLGRFLGRKQDGEPGITVIWRGWQRLQDIAATWYLVKDQP
ncbi:MAG: IS4 family transposase, partial [Anaerolineae bacterium]